MMLRSIGLASAVLAMSSLVASPVGATEMISLVFNSAPKSPQEIGASVLRKKIEELSNHQIIIDARTGSSLGNESSILAAMRKGRVGMATVSGGIISAIVPEFGVFDVPFLFRDAAQAKAIAEGPIAAVVAKHFADKGLVLLAIGNQGFRDVTNSKRPIVTPADLKGLKIRVMPNDTYQMTFKALGAEVEPMEFTQVYLALKDGRIDGEENPIATVAATHFDEVQKYVSLTHHLFTPVAFVASHEVFEALNAADQATIMTAAKAGADATWDAGAAEEAKVLDLLRKGGMQITETVDRQSFVDALKPLEPEFEKRFGKDVLAQIRATR